MGELHSQTSGRSIDGNAGRLNATVVSPYDWTSGYSSGARPSGVGLTIGDALAIVERLGSGVGGTGLDTGVVALEAVAAADPRLGPSVQPAAPAPPLQAATSHALTAINNAFLVPDRMIPSSYIRLAGPRWPMGRRPGQPCDATDGKRVTIEAVTATEISATLQLPGGPIAYTLRRSSRSRGLRVVIHPERGVVVTVPAPGRRGWADPERHVHPFLAEREPWLRRHLDHHARERAELVARGGLRDGAVLRFRGELHRLRLLPAGRASRRSTVERIGGPEGDEIIVHIAPADRRTTAAVLESWLKPRARIEIEREIRRHATFLDVSPTAVSVRDQRTRWGSASREGRLAFSWRLILAPPEALETVVIHELAHLRVFGHGPRFWAVVATRRPDHATWRRWLRDHSTELHGALDERVLDGH